MTVSFIRWVAGSREYRIPSEYADLVCGLISRSGANYRRLKADADGLSFVLPRGEGIAFEKIMCDRMVEFRVIREKGLVNLLGRYKKRIGIPVGAVMFFAVLFMSQQFIWTVEVEGNSKVPTREITARLEELGCGVGSYIPDIDVLFLRDEYLTGESRISWMSVNIRGTVAKIEVRESDIPEIYAPENVPYNLVAGEDGIIEYVEILRGSPTVEAGLPVKKGDLLASGIEDLKHSFRLVHARGTVLASVERQITVEIPLESVRKVLSGREFSRKTLNFFGIAFEFFDNTENISTECDKIERERKLYVFDAVDLPISVKETVFREFTEEKIIYTEAEARSEAYRVMRERCREAALDGELVSRVVREGMTDGVFRIECELTIITDIAKELPIYTGSSK